MHLRVLDGKEHRPSYFEISKPLRRGRGRIHVYVGIVQTLKQKYGIKNYKSFSFCFPSKIVFDWEIQGKSRIWNFSEEKESFLEEYFFFSEEFL